VITTLHPAMPGVWLKDHRVPAFPGTLAYARQVKGAGLEVALLSSSRNAAPALPERLERLELRHRGSRPSNGTRKPP
jgi:hypothetical protein